MEIKRSFNSLFFSLVYCINLTQKLLKYEKKNYYVKAVHG
jgi:hypothetical protein